jgi:hypothetical protein
VVFQDGVGRLDPDAVARLDLLLGELACVDIGDVGLIAVLLDVASECFGESVGQTAPGCVIEPE